MFGSTVFDLIVDINALSGSHPWRHSIQYRAIRRSSSSRWAERARISEEDKTTFAHRRTALRRYGNPEEVAHATLSLVLPATGFITGATLVVDGGVTIRNA